MDPLMAGLDEYDRTTIEYLAFTGVKGALLARVADSLRERTTA